LLAFNKKLIKDLSYNIKNLRFFSKYKSKGIKYHYDIIKLKEGKAKQR
jgi:ribosomal protein L6P/L9E